MSRRASSRTRLLIAATGEPRHLRSSLYDLQTLRRTRLFHNNTVRTIAPEYAWLPSADGRQVLVTAERDGDTVSPERGIYLVVPRRPRDGVRGAGAHRRQPCRREGAARQGRGGCSARSLAAVKRALAEVSTSRIYSYEKALFDFDSKHISKPGNKLAGEYLFNTYRSFGYEPEYQWFEPRGALGGKSANIIATLRGTEQPRNRVRRQQPLRLERLGPGGRRRQFGDGGAAGSRARAGEAADAGHHHLRVVHRARSPGCSAAASSCGARRKAG